MLNHLDAKQLLQDYGIVLEGALCASPKTAKQQIVHGRAYYLKLASSSEEATHKTEFGYVSRVATPEELDSAWQKMEATARSHGHADASFVLQESRSGHEVMIGAKRDPIFGFQIIFTPEGGKYAEISAKAVAPSVMVGRITTDEAKQMIVEHVMSEKLMGARGEEPSDIDSLAATVSAVSQLMDEHPEIHSVDLNPIFATPSGVHVVDARFETGRPWTMPEVETNRSLVVFVWPKRAFVVIASARPNSVGMKLLANATNSVRDVRVMLTTEKGRENLKRLRVPVVDDVPTDCDLLVYAGIPADAPDIVKRFRENGGKGAVIVSSDFAETGNKRLEEDLQKAAGSMPYIGPNCVGVYSESHNTFFIDEKRIAYPATGGSFAFFTQSGSLAAESFCEYNLVHGVPVAVIFSLGNGSGITFTEIVNRVADEPTVDAIVIHLEGGLKEGEGPHFIKALKNATSVKPVIVLPAGVSSKGRESAASHTGRMTGGAEALRAALKQGGAIAALNEEEMRLAIWMLHTLPKASGKAVVLTGGGGKGVLAADAAERVGIELRQGLPVEFSSAVARYLPAFADPSKNPFDFTGSVTLDGIIETLKATETLDSPGVFYYGYHVPGATLSLSDGKAVGTDPVQAVEKIAHTIKECELPLILHIIGQTALARAVERKAEEVGIVVTRTSSPDLVLGALKLTMDVWKRYPEIDFRTASDDYRRSTGQNSSDSLAGAAI